MRISKRLPGKDMKQALGATVIVALLSILACSAPAYAETPAPGWEVIGRAIPTNLPPVAKERSNFGPRTSGLAAGPPERC